MLLKGVSFIIRDYGSLFMFLELKTYVMEELSKHCPNSDKSIHFRLFLITFAIFFDKVSGSAVNFPFTKVNKWRGNFLSNFIFSNKNRQISRPSLN